MAQRGGIESTVAAFERDYHGGRMPSCSVTRLGKIKRNAYFQRLPQLIAACLKVRKAARGSDIIYAFGLDMAILALCASAFRRQRVVLEVGDLTSVQIRAGVVGKAFRRFDAFVTGRCGLLVTTTEQFLNRYYRDWLGVRTDGIVLENKVEEEFADSVCRPPKPANSGGTPLVDRPLRIGWFGLLRCPWTWNVLKSLAQRHPGKFEVVVAGFPLAPSDLHEQCRGLTNVNYLGEYRSPGGLAELYAQVDVVWACSHPRGDADFMHMWARTNRFYESCLFARPLICRAGTADGDVVSATGIGTCIAGPDEGAALEHMTALTPALVQKWAAASLGLPKSVYSYTAEGNRLRDALHTLAASSA